MRGRGAGAGRTWVLPGRWGDRGMGTRLPDHATARGRSAPQRSSETGMSGGIAAHQRLTSPGSQAFVLTPPARVTPERSPPDLSDLTGAITLVELGLGGEGGWFEGRAGCFVGGDLVLVGQGDADVVQAVQQPVARVVVDLERCRDVAGRDRLVFQVDRDLGARVALDRGPQLLDDVLGHQGGEQTGLARVAAED